MRSLAAASSTRSIALSGKKAVGDVAVAHRRGRDQRGILDANAVVRFILLVQSAQDGNRVFDARLIDEDRLKAPFECRVLFDVLAILVERRRADHVQFAACQHRLEQIAGVHRAFGLAGADDGVQLVDEEDDLALGAGDVFEHGFEPFFELAAIFCTGNERAHVERNDALVFQTFGHVAAHDALRQTFDDRRFADARFADQHRVVFGAAREDLNDATNLFVAADDRIELAALGLEREIAAVAFERLVRAFGVFRGDALVAAHVAQRLKQACRE